ncbi:hypothetical protein [Nonomuraea endophytica]|uniref:hypothetical protein n=1 Tax=Nonomuraea endophytica TaxID=714136 RepID=UPI0037C98FBE
MHEFKSTNTAYQPVIKALELVRRYAKAGNTIYYPRGEVVPEHRGTCGARGRTWSSRAASGGGGAWCG